MAKKIAKTAPAGTVAPETAAATGTADQTTAPAVVAAAPAAPAVVAAAPAAPATPPVPKDQRNGITRPAAGTQTGKVWDIAERLSTKDAEGRITTAATRKAVVDAGTAEGINASTCTTQFGKWAKYYGFTGTNSPSRKDAPAATPAPVAQAAVAPAAAPVAEAITPAPFDSGYDAYVRTQAGEQGIFNPYAEGTEEHGKFVNGWNSAHTDAENAKAAQGAQ